MVDVIGLNFGHDAGVARVSDRGAAVVVETEKQIGVRHACAGGTEQARQSIRSWLRELGRGEVPVGISDYSFVRAPVTPSGLDDLLRDPSWSTFVPARDSVVRRISPGDWYLAGDAGSEVYAVRHHYAHCAVAYYTSGEDRALVLALDGTGNFAECGMVCTGEDGVLNPVLSFNNIDGPRFGLMYESLSRRIFATGFDTGKLLGLTALGRPDEVLLPVLAALACPNRTRRAHPDLFEPVAEGLLADTAVRYDGEWYEYQPAQGGYVEHLLDGARATTQWFGSRFPDAFRAGGKVISYPAHAPDDQATRSVAATLQAVIERGMVHLTAGLRRRFPSYDTLCYAGGCALNITANSAMLAAGSYRRIHIPSCADDSGIAVGAALAVASVPLTQDEVTFGGPALDRERFPGAGTVRFSSTAEMVETAAGWLAEGEVIAWVQGGVETGPRALGHRSLLVSPHVPGARKLVSERIKQREWFRPVAPICTAEAAGSYFGGPVDHAHSMLFACTVLPEVADRLAEVRHFDGTARLQTVRREHQEELHELLTAVERHTGLPILINTSLNPGGRPLLNSADDIVDFLADSPIRGVFVVDDRLVWCPKK